jgi:hypothetical protein
LPCEFAGCSYAYNGGYAVFFRCVCHIHHICRPFPQYFPKTEPYISLFPKGGLSEQAKEKQREIVDSIAAAVAAKKLPHASHTFTGERHNGVYGNGYGCDRLEVFGWTLPAVVHFD